jgi:hypothetical protein
MAKAKKRKPGRKVARGSVPELNQISVWKITDRRAYGLSIYQPKTGSYIDTGREFSGPEIDAIRAWLKKQKAQLSLDADWKPFLRKMGKSI